MKILNKIYYGMIQIKYNKDTALFDEILKVKRVKAQLYHDRSEDAVSWNIFRFIERNKLFPEFLKNPKNYKTGGNNWFKKVFKVDSNYEKIIQVQKYELMRFWLLGTWIANGLNFNFYLVNLMRKELALKESEENIERKFDIHIEEDERKKFVQITWEDIYEYILNSNLAEKVKAPIVEFFKNKSMGYDKSSRKLLEAFSISR